MVCRRCKRCRKIESSGKWLTFECRRKSIGEVVVGYVDGPHYDKADLLLAIILINNSLQTFVILYY